MPKTKTKKTRKAPKVIGWAGVDKNGKILEMSVNKSLVAGNYHKVKKVLIQIKD